MLLLGETGGGVPVQVNLQVNRTTQFGLVAEDVEKVNPDLVARDKEGKTIHRPLRRGERDVAQRVSKRAPQSRAAGETS
jgi:hypothetical protein